MHLSDHDLRQLDEAYLDGLTPQQARALLSKALADLKLARERLGQNPSNSSRPPSSRAPWEQAGVQDTESDPRDDARQGQGEVEAKARGKGAKRKDDKGAGAQPGRAGRRKGTPGHSRRQQLPIDAERTHAADHCSACGAQLDASAPSCAHNARYEIDLVQPDGLGSGLVVRHTKHIYLDRQCACGHVTRAQPHRCGPEAEWGVALSQWHLAGPTLVAFICALTQRMRLSRARVREFLADWLGLSLSTATINQCIHEAGRAVEPALEQEIHATIREIALVYADETSWKEHGRLFWLWVFTCATATLFVVGPRSREIVQRVLGEHFRNWLMSDGYLAYREIDQRLRCLAHVIRKAHGLEESFGGSSQRFGRHVLDVIETVIKAVYDARGAPEPAPDLRARHAPQLNALLADCQRLANAPHEKTRALARELLNDWDTFWVVLDHPELPLTNNEAERALRHWVIARRIGMGTRTAQGTRAFACWPASSRPVANVLPRRGPTSPRPFANAEADWPPRRYPLPPVESPLDGAPITRGG
jgi:transposase